ncbi:HAD family hydrolase [Epibacterium sp. MM17-32]|uniref:HAD family hydrolase n=1 Tax=Epibacterium sp. MM17-32 TaxID=2917734 RepID=UPI001EF69806|nr:HAD family hydrolase [Epibacterium sp. MM17-32]MCG7627851.1 HAD family hydrolase [Epibacterium sp. MM17-32]
MTLSALLFDKDGTLFDFAMTWNGWAKAMLTDLAAGDDQRLSAMAAAVRYDLATAAFRPDSLVIAGTNDEVAEVLAPHVPHMDRVTLADYLIRTAAEAELAQAVPLAPYLAALRTGGLKLGVMTNDGEHSARRHLTRSGVYDHFHMVIGADSGYGAKPDPEPLLAFCAAQGVRPEETAMVGDSRHDLIAGRAAGMRTIGVLTGMASAEDLAPLADVVLPNIGHIPDWLAAGDQPA